MDQTLPKAIIVDLDGTLANVDHRMHYIQGSGKKDWKGFFKDMAKDEHEEWCRLITNHLPVTVLLVTGRPGDYEEVTREWLKAKDIHFDQLLMRRKGDFRPDTVVKKEIYEEKIRKNYDIAFVVDDRAAVVEMWRSLGLTCLQCQEGDY